MVANANNNNNNNNLNDNKFNGNQNDVNEGNANAGVEAMNMIGMGRGFEFDKGKSATLVWKYLDLWMRIQAANSKDCQRLEMCLVNEDTAPQDWVLSQICSLGVAKFAAQSNQTDVKLLLLAGQYGRSGLNCSQIYDECSLNEQRFIDYAQVFSWNPLGELKHVQNLVQWIFNK